jgi:hypothetical protein
MAIGYIARRVARPPSNPAVRPGAGDCLSPNLSPAFAFDHTQTDVDKKFNG